MSTREPSSSHDCAAQTLQQQIEADRREMKETAKRKYESMTKSQYTAPTEPFVLEGAYTIVKIEDTALVDDWVESIARNKNGVRHVMMMLFNNTDVQQDGFRIEKRGDNKYFFYLGKTIRLLSHLVINQPCFLDEWPSDPSVDQYLFGKTIQ